MSTRFWRFNKYDIVSPNPGLTYFMIDRYRGQYQNFTESTNKGEAVNILVF